MTKIENIDALDILGVTGQQMSILKAVYRINSENKTATPREIELTCSREFGFRIQKSNLFRQMRVLLDKGFLTRDGEASYRLSFGGIKKAVDSRKQEYSLMLGNFEKLAGELEDYFRKVSMESRVPVVEYLNYSELFDRIAKSVRASERFLATGKFPILLYRREIAKSIGRAEFWDALHKIFFDERLEVVYITGLDLDSPYNHALGFYRNPKKAYRETLMILDNLLDYSERYENLKVMYLEKPYGLDILIPETKSLNEYYQFMRDGRMNITGGIYIQSHETTRQAVDTYMNALNTAVQVKGSLGGKIVKKLKNELRLKYYKS